MKEYYLCSSEVVARFPDLEKSRPFKSGYPWETGKDYYVVSVEDWDEIQRYYEKVIVPHNASHLSAIDFWIYECCASLLTASQITKSGIKKHGLFVEIEQKSGLTKDENRAYALHIAANRCGMNPLEFMNSI